jgi:hypothetical protein
VTSSLLWEDVDDPAVLDEVTIKHGLDDVKYLPDASSGESTVTSSRGAG